MIITLTFDTSTERASSYEELQSLKTTLRTLGYKVDFVHVDEVTGPQYANGLARLRGTAT